MKKKFIIGSLVTFLLLSLSGCNCEHKFDDGVITKEATCTNEGEKTYICTLCKKETKTESIPLKEHSYEETITKKATVKEEGEKTFKCKYCGDTYTEAIPVVENPIGSRTNPYKFTDVVHLDYVENLRIGSFKGGMTIKFLDYDKSSHVIKVKIKLEDTNSPYSVEPFGGLVVGAYVCSDFQDLDYIQNSTDKPQKDILFTTSLSLYAGGKGKAYIYPIKDKLSDKPAYITLTYIDAEGETAITWIKLP